MSDPNNPNNRAKGGDPTTSSKKSADDMRKRKIEALLDINGLNSYDLPDSFALEVSRIYKRQRAQHSVYSSKDSTNVIKFTLTSGRDWINGKDCFITLDLKIAPLAVGDGNIATNYNNGFAFGNTGSGANLFSEVRLTHQSNQVIDTMRSANLTNTYRSNYMMDSDYRKTKLSAALNEKQPHQNDYEGDYTTTARRNFKREIKVNETVHVAIPLSAIHPLFASDKLLPSFLMAGMSIELTLEKAVIAFIAKNSAVLGITHVTDFFYTVSNPTLQLDAHTLSDAAQRKLAQVSANDGLDVEFDAWHVISQRSDAQTRATVYVSKALSRVNEIVIIPRNKGQLDEQLINADHAAAEFAFALDSLSPTQKYAITNWQMQIGSQYYPSHAVDQAADSYLISMQGLPKSNCVTFDQYCKGGYGLMRYLFERSAILTQSGLAISANRGAQIEIDKSTTIVHLDTLVGYTKLVTAFLSQAVIRE